MQRPPAASAPIDIRVSPPKLTDVYFNSIDNILSKRNL